MRSHFMVSRGFAVACAASGAAALPAGDCQAQIAFDNPGQSAYDNGWQAGDNGGFGFGPWSMFGTYITKTQHVLDSATIHNNVKAAPVNPGVPRSWALYNAVVNGPGQERDVSQAGRRLLTPLQVGQKISVVIDNPTERLFFRGYTVRFNTGGNNTVYSGTAQSRLSVGVFDYFSYGKWYVGAAPGVPQPTLFDVNTNQGLRIEMTLTAMNTFTLTMTPLNNPGIAFTTSGALTGPAGSPIDWIEFELFNTDSDWYPAPSPPGGETDFYIGSMQVLPPGTACYPNCDGSTGAPRLTPNDFQCFLNRFAAGASYANCDQSTGMPALTPNDFQCFLDQFAAGCS